MSHTASAQLRQGGQGRSSVHGHEDRVLTVNERPGDRFTLCEILGLSLLAMQGEEDFFGRIFGSEKNSNHFDQPAPVGPLLLYQAPPERGRDR